MNKAVFRYLAPKMIRSKEARRATEIYMFSNVSAYQAEVQVYGTGTVTVKKIADRLDKHYQEAMTIAALSGES